MVEQNLVLKEALYTNMNSNLILFLSSSSPLNENNKPELLRIYLCKF